jgi:hypothetical protein
LVFRLEALAWAEAVGRLPPPFGAGSATTGLDAARAKCPGLIFRKRDAEPLAAISRDIAAYNVAVGVLPLGLVHRLELAIRSTSWATVSPESAFLPVSDAKTLAAASSALSGRADAFDDGVRARLVLVIAGLVRDSRSVSLAWGFITVDWVVGPCAAAISMRAFRRERDATCVCSSCCCCF